MSELKACPFCGSKAEKHKYTMLGEDFKVAYCPNEDCYFHHRTASIADWNTRPIEDALDKRIAELEGVIKADNERLIRAGLTVGLYSGCDTAETMAEVILASRDRIAELETERDEARAMAERLIKAGNVLIETFQNYPDFEEYPEVGKWDILVDEWKEREG